MYRGFALLDHSLLLSPREFHGSSTGAGAADIKCNSPLQYLSTTLNEDVKMFTAMPRDYQPQQAYPKRIKRKVSKQLFALI